MDSYEATRMVFSRIQNLDPENASKIMGYLLIQDHGEKEMIRLAFGPETLIHNLIIKAKSHLGILNFQNNAITPPSSSSPSTPSSPFNPISRPNPLSISSSSPSSTPWPLSGLSSPHSPSVNGFSSSLSYANIVNGSSNAANSESLYNNGDVIDEFQLQDHLSFLNESKGEDLFDPRLELGYSPADSQLHRGSFSVPGATCFGSEDANSPFGWKQCLYFAKGFCKNGGSCKFLHGDSVSAVADAVASSAAVNVGSPNKLNEFEKQRKLAAVSSQFMGAVSFPYNKSAALMVGDELHKFGRCRPERASEFSAMGLGGSANPGSRQIYLTFPADSTFREEDVSNYFSNYGPVQDVRIPYQQKRMFGFVTFVYPETVKFILAKGNPHFVCDSRVLVKPYKEKGKVPEKKQQQIERSEYSACSSPSGLDSREPFDFQLGARMFYNTQEMLLRRKLEEQADLQQAIELHGRRLMNLQLLDLKNNHHHHHHNHHQFHHILPNGSPIPSPTLPQTPHNQALIFPIDGPEEELQQEICGSPAEDSQNAADPDGDQEVNNPIYDHNNGNANSSSSSSSISSSTNKKEKSSSNNNTEESDLHESLEHILPDNLFASPKKSTVDELTVFSSEADDKLSASSTTITSTINMASLKSCFLQMPRFSSGHGTIGL
ncbi:hypothetical protein Pint_31003 [Pistacia integerrima]|uniref:Uncharacterized protein n=1 Tax=Pistacia integerrima TaxID=434235 RepID=A0ACC0XRM3_9ROSI|nr:hypothetical protein Pint_31003 [Pistacia integerrima]